MLATCLQPGDVVLQYWHEPNGSPIRNPTAGIVIGNYGTRYIILTPDGPTSNEVVTVEVKYKEQDTVYIIDPAQEAAS